MIYYNYISFCFGVLDLRFVFWVLIFYVVCNIDRKVFLKCLFGL